MVLNEQGAFRVNPADDPVHGLVRHFDTNSFPVQLKKAFPP
jgi:hypothetical protein